MQLTVSGGTPGTVAPGLVIELTFSKGGQVQGKNPETGTIYTPSYYSYTDQGANAKIYLEYDDYANHSNTFVLEPYSSSDISTGEYTAEVESGSSSYSYYGTYKLLSKSNVDLTDDTSQTGCGDTGTLVFYTSNSSAGGSISVSLDGSYVGSLSSYFSSGAISTCNASQSGVIYRTVDAGSHYISASSPSLIWAQNYFSLTDCECFTYELE